MDVNLTTEEILAAWQAMIEANQEAGTAPLLTLGESVTLLDGMPGLIAYHELATTRTDLTEPAVQAGGSSGLWFAMLSDESPRTAMPLFAGADAASVLAMETLHVRQVHANRHLPATALPGRLPAGFVAHLEPTAIAGRTLSWSALPFALMNPAPMQAETSAADAATDWTATAAVFLALCLILLALVI